MEISGLEIMVTGAGGFIGSHLSDRLAADASNQLLLIDDFSIGSMDNLTAAEARPNVRIVAADVTDQERMTELMAGIDVVFHLAISCLRTSLNQPWLSHDVNAGGTLSVCLAAREHGVRRFVYISSSEIYGSAQTAPMAESHLCHPTTGRSCRDLPKEGVCEHSRLARCWYRTDDGRHGAVARGRDFTYVDDTVTGIVQAAACDELIGDAVNVAYGREVSINQITEMLMQLTGRTDLKAVHTEPRPGDVHRHFADVRKAERLFGWAPEIDIETGLARTVEWFRHHRNASEEEIAAAAVPNW